MAETKTTTTTPSTGGGGSTGQADFELHYFDGIRGTVQMIRWILIDANASWTEKLVSMDEWPKYKLDESYSGIFGTLPVLLVNDSNTRISQILAIVAYLGQRLDYYGSDVTPEGIAHCMSICSAVVTDIVAPLSKMLNTLALPCGVDFDNLYDAYAPKILEALHRLDHLLHRDNEFFCGDQISVADLLVFDGFEIALILFGPGIAGKFQHLNRFHDRIKDRPRLKEYRWSGKMPGKLTLAPKYDEFVELNRARFRKDFPSIGAPSFRLDPIRTKEEAKQKDVQEQQQEQEVELKAMSKENNIMKKKKAGKLEKKPKKQKDVDKEKQLEENIKPKDVGVGVPLHTGVHSHVV